MGERAIENRIRKLKALEEQIKLLEQETIKLKEEIKREMDSRTVEELKVGNFLIRWKTIVSNTFDAKTFQENHKDLYQQYLKRSVTKRFTVM